MYLTASGHVVSQLLFSHLKWVIFAVIQNCILHLVREFILKSSIKNILKVLKMMIILL